MLIVFIIFFLKRDSLIDEGKTIFSSFPSKEEIFTKFKDKRRERHGISKLKKRSIFYRPDNLQQKKNLTKFTVKDAKYLS